MVAVNMVILAGNLTRDPEQRFLPQGTPITTFGMAVNKSYTTKEGEKREEVCFIDVEVWGAQAEACSQYLTKGRPVMVEGSLKFDSWESKEGQKRSRHFVRAARVQFLPSAKPEGEGDRGPGAEGEGGEGGRTEEPEI